MHDHAWTKERFGELSKRILEKSLSHVPDNLKALHDRIAVVVSLDRSQSGNNMRADYTIDGIPYISKTSWYEPGRKMSSMCERLVQNLSVVDALAQDRQTDNSLMIETNVYNYLGQWLSDEQILNLMSDTTRGVRLITKKNGQTKTESIGSGRGIEIYERSSGKIHKQMTLQVTRGCMFGQWRLTPEAKWVDHGIVVHAIYPEIIMESLRTVGEVIQHPSLDPAMAITKVKPSKKTTRFSAEISTISRRTVIRRAARCSGDTPYAYRMT